MPKLHHAGTAVFTCPDGIEPSAALAALLEVARDERAAFRAIVRSAVEQAIAEASGGEVRTRGLNFPKSDIERRWQMIAVGVAKAALGLRECLGEITELWPMEGHEVAEAVTEHVRRMRLRAGWWEYRADAERVAQAVGHAVGGLVR